jgi:hypothetical protein
LFAPRNLLFLSEALLAHLGSLLILALQDQESSSISPRVTEKKYLSGCHIRLSVFVPPNVVHHSSRYLYRRQGQARQEHMVFWLKKKKEK